MRYFLTGWVLLVILAVGILGFRGGLSRKPPLEFFDDMDRQLKLRPQQPNEFFGDDRASRLPVLGTVARSKPIQNVSAAGGAAPAVMAFESNPVTTGQITGTTNYLEVNPMEITSQFLARGRQRFQIYCQPCHGPLGDGNGVTKKLGMGVVANLHEPRIAKMADGEIFGAITVGSRSTVMASYASVLSLEDRWAVVAYVRALQLSRLGTLDDVPVDYRASLKK